MINILSRIVLENYSLEKKKHAQDLIKYWYAVDVQLLHSGICYKEKIIVNRKI